jgi:hypothetical protein
MEEIEALEKIMKEKISADHLMYVSMKYTKTCDVMVNLIKRWQIMIDYAFEALLDRAKKKKMIKVIPTAPKLKLDLVREAFSGSKEVIDALNEYEMFKLISSLQQQRSGEFRKGVCLTVTYRGQEVRIDLDKLKEYTDILERFINYTKLFLSQKN